MHADDIVRQRFTKVFRGYDVQEVDIFLDEVIRTIDELEKERNVLLSRVEALLNELDRYDVVLKGNAPVAAAARQEIPRQAAFGQPQVVLPSSTDMPQQASQPINPIIPAAQADEIPPVETPFCEHPMEAPPAFGHPIGEPPPLAQ